MGGQNTKPKVVQQIKRDNVLTNTSVRNFIKTRHRKMQSYFLVWIDANIDLTKEEFQDSLARLRSVFSDVNICTVPMECIKILSKIDGNKAFVIVSEALGDNLVSEIHSMPRVHAIYIISDDHVQYENWAADCSKIRGTYPSIESICESLKVVVHQLDHDNISMSFFPKQKTTEIIKNTSNKRNLDELPPSYMYSFIFKQIVLEMDDDNTKHVNDFIDYFRRTGVRESELIDFQNQYNQNSVLFWYTKDSFVYRRLNQALRSLNTEMMVKMSFFIRHLHLQLQQLHQQQSIKFREQFTVYRGQGLSGEDFQILHDTEGGLLSFDNFLSTTKNRKVAMIYAPNAVERNEELIGVLFAITIDPNKVLTTRTPYALIDAYSAFSSEEEILFTMHTVFRVIAIRQIAENDRLWEVQLILTDDTDQDMAALTNRLQNELDGKGWYRMGKLMFLLGDFNQAEELYNRLFEDATTDEERAHIYHKLGCSMHQQAKHKEATFHLNKYVKNVLAADDLALAAVYNYLASLHCTVLWQTIRRHLSIRL